MEPITPQLQNLLSLEEHKPLKHPKQVCLAGLVSNHNNKRLQGCLVRNKIKEDFLRAPPGVLLPFSAANNPNTSLKANLKPQQGLSLEELSNRQPLARTSRWGRAVFLVTSKIRHQLAFLGRTKALLLANQIKLPCLERKTRAELEAKRAFLANSRMPRQDSTTLQRQREVSTASRKQAPLSSPTSSSRLEEHKLASLMVMGWEQVILHNLKTQFLVNKISNSNRAVFLGLNPDFPNPKLRQVFSTIKEGSKHKEDSLPLPGNPQHLANLHPCSMVELSQVSPKIPV